MKIETMGVAPGRNFVVTNEAGDVVMIYGLLMGATYVLSKDFDEIEEAVALVRAVCRKPFQVGTKVRVKGDSIFSGQTGVVSLMVSPTAFEVMFEFSGTLFGFEQLEKVG